MRVSLVFVPAVAALVIHPPSRTRPSLPSFARRSVARGSFPVCGLFDGNPLSGLFGGDGESQNDEEVKVQPGETSEASTKRLEAEKLQLQAEIAQLEAEELALRARASKQSKAGGDAPDAPAEVTAATAATAAAAADESKPSSPLPTAAQPAAAAGVDEGLAEFCYAVERAAIVAGLSSTEALLRSVRSAWAAGQVAQRAEISRLKRTLGQAVELERAAQEAEDAGPRSFGDSMSETALRLEESERSRKDQIDAQLLWTMAENRTSGR
jgi:hypothetical protein